MSLMVEGWGGWGAGPNMWRTFRQEVGGAGGAATRPPSWNADPCHPATKEKRAQKHQQRCRTGMFIPSEKNFPSRIQQRKRGEKKIK
jgi:hypothetical protein